MARRILLLYGIFLTAALVVLVARQGVLVLRGRKHGSAVDDSFSMKLVFACMVPSIWYGVVWVWSGSFESWHIALLISVTLLAEVVSIGILRSFDPEAREWGETGARILIELFLGSPLQAILKSVILALNGLAALIVVFVLALSLWGDANTYPRALTYAGLISFDLVLISALMRVPILLYRPLDDASRLRIALGLVAAAVPAITLVALGDKNWPWGLEVTLNGHVLQLPGLVLAMIGALVVSPVAPAIIGSVRRHAWHLAIFRAENLLITRFNRFMSELSAEFGTLERLKEVRSEVRRQVLERATSTFGLPQLALQFLVDAAQEERAKRSTRDLETPLRLPGRAYWIFLRRLSRIDLPSGPVWSRLSGWSLALRALSKISPYAAMVAYFSYDEEFYSMARWQRWLLRMFRLSPSLIKPKALSFRQAFQRLVASLESMPDDDPRWRHVIRLSGLSDLMNASIASIEATGDDETTRSDLLKKFGKEFDDELKKTSEAEKLVRESKKVGARLLMPLATPMTMAILTPVLQSLLLLK